MRRGVALCLGYRAGLPNGMTKDSLMREVCGKPGAARIFKKSFDTDEFFGALQKLCGFEYNRVNG